MNGAEVLALRRNNQHAAWTGGEQVAGGIKLEAVAAAAFTGGAQRARVKKDVAFAKRAISLKVKRMNARLPATLGDVQRLFIHGQCDAVGELDGIGQQRELTTGTEAVHALK